MLAYEEIEEDNCRYDLLSTENMLTLGAPEAKPITQLNKELRRYSSHKRYTYLLRKVIERQLVELMHS